LRVAADGYLKAQYDVSRLSKLKMKGLMFMLMIAITTAMPFKFPTGKVTVPKVAPKAANNAQPQRVTSAKQLTYQEAYEKYLREQYEINRSNAFDELDE
jgi:hypothetical protein